MTRTAVRLARDAHQESTQEDHPGLEESDEAAAGPPESGPGLSGVPGMRAEEYPTYYLQSRGRRAFEKRLGFRVPLRVRLRRFSRAHATGGYFGAIAAVTVVLLCSLLFCTWTAGAGLPVLLLLGLLGLAPASEIAVSLVHRLVTLLVSPRLHPKLKLLQGVPPHWQP